MPPCDGIRADSFGVVSIEKRPNPSPGATAPAAAARLIGRDNTGPVPLQHSRPAAPPRRPSPALVEAAWNAVRSGTHCPPGRVPWTATRHRITAAATRGAILTLHPLPRFSLQQVRSLLFFTVFVFYSSNARHAFARSQAAGLRLSVWVEQTSRFGGERAQSHGRVPGAGCVVLSGRTRCRVGRFRGGKALRPSQAPWI